jgi:hypothetical protein
MTIAVKNSIAKRFFGFFNLHGKGRLRHKATFARALKEPFFTENDDVIHLLDRNHIENIYANIK